MNQGQIPSRTKTETKQIDQGARDKKGFKNIGRLKKAGGGTQATLQDRGWRQVGRRERGGEASQEEKHEQQRVQEKCGDALNIHDPLSSV